MSSVRESGLRFPLLGSGRALGPCPRTQLGVTALAPVASAPFSQNAWCCAWVASPCPGHGRFSAASTLVCPSRSVLSMLCASGGSYEHSTHVTSPVSQRLRLVMGDGGTLPSAGFHVGWPSLAALAVLRSVDVMQLCCLRAEVMLGGQTAASGHCHISPQLLSQSSAPLCLHHARATATCVRGGSTSLLCSRFPCPQQRSIPVVQIEK